MPFKPTLRYKKRSRKPLSSAPFYPLIQKDFFSGLSLKAVFKNLYNVIVYKDQEFDDDFTDMLSN